MKSFTRAIFFSLSTVAIMGIVGCEDNEKAGGVAAGPTTNEGADKVKPMSPEEYAKKNAKGASAGGGSYPGAKKAGGASPAAPK